MRWRVFYDAIACLNQISNLIIIMIDSNLKLTVFFLKIKKTIFENAPR